MRAMSILKGIATLEGVSQAEAQQSLIEEQMVTLQDQAAQLRAQKEEIYARKNNKGGTNT
jgi:hypothetical protein